MTLPDVWALAAITTKFALYLGVLVSSGTVFTSLVFRLNSYRGVSTSFGILGLCTLSFQLAGIAILTFGLLLGQPGRWISAFGGLIAIWSFSNIGHIAGYDKLLLKITLTTHLTAIAFWIGILAPLRSLSLSKQTWPEAADLGQRFGVIAKFIVPLLIAAGIYMSYILVGSLDALINTGYGQALILKLTVVSLLLALAAANKLRFIPGLHKNNPNAAKNLIRSILAEWVAIFAILGITAVMTSSLTLPV
jgi:putative copper resistance protein D